MEVTSQSNGPPEGWTLYRSASPFMEHMGDMWELWDEEAEKLHRGFYALHQHTNAQGFLHGGSLMTFADSVMAKNVWFVSGRRSVTAQMNVSFLAPVREGQWVVGISHAERVTQSMMFLKLIVEAENHPCVSATAIFRLGKKKTSAFKSKS